MIIGLGTDICDIARIGRLLERYGDRFTRRCFTLGEIHICSRYGKPAEQFAARIAAKEAASKALGTVGGRASTGNASRCITNRAASLSCAFTDVPRNWLRGWE